MERKVTLKKVFWKESSFEQCGSDINPDLNIELHSHKEQIKELENKNIKLKKTVNINTKIPLVIENVYSR